MLHILDYSRFTFVMILLSTLFTLCVSGCWVLLPRLVANLCILMNPSKNESVIRDPLFTCLSRRSLHRLHCQQAVLDKLGQWHYQQVQSWRHWAGGAGDSKEGVSQRHSSGSDGWVELVTSASDCHWGISPRVWRDYLFNQLSGCWMETFRRRSQQLCAALCEVAGALDN